MDNKEIVKDINNNIHDDNESKNGKKKNVKSKQIKSNDEEIDMKQINDEKNNENIQVKKTKERKKKIDDKSGGNIKEKKELNPIMKEMNRFRNEIIGQKIGSKSPKLTIPPFKKCINDARIELNIEESRKNNLEIVHKAIELFNNNNNKYIESSKIE